MKIILNKDVVNLGEEGDVKEVAPGYARNYLIPKGFGVTYTKQNLALLEGKKKAIEKRKEEKKEQAAGLKDRIEALDLKITMTVGENGRLFGSVTNAMIAEELAKVGIEIERKKVEIPEHTIKNTGNFVIKVKLYGSEVASLKVAVSGPAGEQPAAAEAGEESAEEEATVEAEAAGETAVAEAPEESETADEPADEAVEETAAESPESEQAEVAEQEQAAAEEPASEHAEGEQQEPEQSAAEEAETDQAAAGEEPADRE